MSNKVTVCLKWVRLFYVTVRTGCPERHQQAADRTAAAGGEKRLPVMLFPRVAPTSRRF